MHSQRFKTLLITQSPSSKSLKKGKKALVPLVESEVRRSPRIKENNKGFKTTSCTSKKCLACNPNPLDLSLSMIKNLGTTYCQVEEGLLSEKALNMKKKKSSKTVGKKQLKENKVPNVVKNS
jgi:hypothetical protein